MNTNVKYILAFASGAVIGSALTWKLLKSKYEQIAQDEINFQVERFSRKESKLNKELNDVNDALDTYKKVEKAQVEEYKKIVAERDYTDYTRYSNSNPKAQEKEEEEEDLKPYVITPEEFDEKVGYSLINLTYYSDGVLADDDCLIEDVDKVVGVGSLDRIGEYEDDVLHVRNDKLKCDYEILRDNRKYRDLIGINSHQAED